MTYREVPAWLATDTDPTILLNGTAMTPESVAAFSGIWTAATVEVRLAWTDRLFVHASAAIADANNRLALELDQSAVPVTNDADASEANTPVTEPVFTPESDRREFEVRLVADDSADDDHRDSDRPER
ncbi:hypothetical protein [Halorussus pelagicus]|uniref:hypothetical protein n=1 Tax=Halorussus pelagicus TaxID=2505977 RepID=UPI000FFCAAAD|nr:hypothetical protein [Halorussus pelagicus]